MPDETKHHIVALDNWVIPPTPSFPHTSTHHIHTPPSDLPSRIATATIVIVSGTPLTRAQIASAPRLQLISANGTGTDHIDKEAAREFGVAVCRVPAQNSVAVSEHAIAMVFALRRRVVEMHAVTMDGGVWKREVQLAGRMGRPPRGNAEEVVVVVGYGAVGRNVEVMAKALGMRVLVAERKGVAEREVREGRTGFEEAVRMGTVFVLATPLDEGTRAMFGKRELEVMDDTALIVNVGRGGVVEEAALAEALREGRIGGAAMDVFEREPATRENCVLLEEGIPNLILSPHVAWYSRRTIEGTRETVRKNLEAWVKGEPQNLVVDPR